MEQNTKNTLKGSLMLLLTACIWGSAFVAQRLGMTAMGPFTFNAIRSLIGGTVLLPLIWWQSRHRTTPIVTISRLQYPEETPVNGISQETILAREKRTVIHSSNMHRRIKAGDSRIHFIDGRKMLDGTPEECFVDLIHPNDLGMTKIADALAPRLAVIAE